MVNGFGKSWSEGWQFAPLRDLTLSETRDIRDAVENIRHLADTKNDLLLGKERRDRQEVDKAVGGDITNGSGRAPRVDNRGDPTFADRAIEGALAARAKIAAPKELISELEGFKEGGGALTQNVWDVVHDAVFNEVNPRLKAASEESAALWLKHYSAQELWQLDKRAWVPELGESWSKRRILNLLQNWGNDGNRDAILRQANRRLSLNDVAALFKRLDQRDGRFIQERWDYLDSFFPELDAATRRRTGLPLKKVEASPFSFDGKDGQGHVRRKYRLGAGRQRDRRCAGRS